MPTYSIKAPNGRVYEITGPNGASQQDVINEVLRQYPDAAGTSQAAPQPPAPKPVSAADFGYSALGGIGSLVAFPGQLYGLATGDVDNRLTQAGESITKYAKEQQSEGLKARQAAQQAAIAAADKEGVLSGFGTAITSTLKDPVLLGNFIAENIPNLIPGFGIARGTMSAGMRMAAKEIAAQGLEGEARAAALKAAQDALVKKATAASVGTAAVQQGSDVGAQAYEDIYKKLKEKGASNEDAASQALSLARSAGASAAVISYLSTRLPGARALEEAFVGAKGAKAAATGALKGFLGEAASEAVEEGGGKFAQNVAMSTVDPTQNLMQGVGSAAGMGALLGGTLGGVAGMRNSMREADIATQQDILDRQKAALDKARADQQAAVQRLARLQDPKYLDDLLERSNKVNATLQELQTAAKGSADATDPVAQAEKQNARRALAAYKKSDEYKAFVAEIGPAAPFLRKRQEEQKAAAEQKEAEQLADPAYRAQLTQQLQDLERARAAATQKARDAVQAGDFAAATELNNEVAAHANNLKDLKKRIKALTSAPSQEPPPLPPLEDVQRGIAQLTKVHTEALAKGDADRANQAVTELQKLTELQRQHEAQRYELLKQQEAQRQRTEKALAESTAPWWQEPPPSATPRRWLPRELLGEEANRPMPPAPVRRIGEAPAGSYTFQEQNQLTEAEQKARDNAGEAGVQAELERLPQPSRPLISRQEGLFSNLEPDQAQTPLEYASADSGRPLDIGVEQRQGTDASRLRDKIALLQVRADVPPNTRQQLQRYLDVLSRPEMETEQRSPAAQAAYDHIADAVERVAYRGEGTYTANRRDTVRDRLASNTQRLADINGLLSQALKDARTATSAEDREALGNTIARLRRTAAQLVSDNRALRGELAAQPETLTYDKQEKMPVALPRSGTAIEDAPTEAQLANAALPLDQQNRNYNEIGYVNPYPSEQQQIFESNVDTQQPYQPLIGLSAEEEEGTAAPVSYAATPTGRIAAQQAVPYGGARQQGTTEVTRKGGVDQTGRTGPVRREAPTDAALNEQLARLTPEDQYTLSLWDPLFGEDSLITREVREKQAALDAVQNELSLLQQKAQEQRNALAQTDAQLLKLVEATPQAAQLKYLTGLLKDAETAEQKLQPFTENADQVLLAAQTAFNNIDNTKEMQAFQADLEGAVKVSRRLMEDISLQRQRIERLTADGLFDFLSKPGLANDAKNARRQLLQLVGAALGRGDVSSASAGYIRGVVDAAKTTDFSNAKDVRAFLESHMPAVQEAFGERVAGLLDTVIRVNAAFTLRNKVNDAFFAEADLKARLEEKTRARNKARAQMETLRAKAKGVVDAAQAARETQQAQVGYAFSEVLRLRQQIDALLADLARPDLTADIRTLKELRKEQEATLKATDAAIESYATNEGRLPAKELVVARTFEGRVDTETGAAIKRGSYTVAPAGETTYAERLARAKKDFEEALARRAALEKDPEARGLRSSIERARATHADILARLREIENEKAQTEDEVERLTEVFATFRDALARVSVDIDALADRAAAAEQGTAADTLEQRAYRQIAAASIAEHRGAEKRLLDESTTLTTRISNLERQLTATQNLLGRDDRARVNKLAQDKRASLEQRAAALKEEIATLNAQNADRKEQAARAASMARAAQNIVAKGFEPEIRSLLKAANEIGTVLRQQTAELAAQRRMVQPAIRLLPKNGVATDVAQIPKGPVAKAAEQEAQERADDKKRAALQDELAKDRATSEKYAADIVEAERARDDALVALQEATPQEVRLAQQYAQRAVEEYNDAKAELETAQAELSQSQIRGQLAFPTQIEEQLAAVSSEEYKRLTLAQRNSVDAARAKVAAAKARASGTPTETTRRLDGLQQDYDAAKRAHDRALSRMDAAREAAASARKRHADVIDPAYARFAEATDRLRTLETEYEAWQDANRERTRRLMAVATSLPSAEALAQRAPAEPSTHTTLGDAAKDVAARIRSKTAEVDAAEQRLAAAEEKFDVPKRHPFRLDAAARRRELVALYEEQTRLGAEGLPPAAEAPARPAAALPSAKAADVFGSMVSAVEEGRVGLSPRRAERPTPPERLPDEPLSVYKARKEEYQEALRVWKEDVAHEDEMRQLQKSVEALTEQLNADYQQAPSDALYVRGLKQEIGRLSAEMDRIESQRAEPGVITATTLTATKAPFRAPVQKAQENVRLATEFRKLWARREAYKEHLDRILSGTASTFVSRREVDVVNEKVRDKEAALAAAQNALEAAKNSQRGTVRLAAAVEKLQNELTALKKQQATASLNWGSPELIVQRAQEAATRPNSADAQIERIAAGQTTGRTGAAVKNAMTAAEQRTGSPESRGKAPSGVTNKTGTRNPVSERQTQPRPLTPSQQQNRWESIRDAARKELAEAQQRYDAVAAFKGASKLAIDNATSALNAAKEKAATAERQFAEAAYRAGWTPDNTTIGVSEEFLAGEELASAQATYDAAVKNKLPAAQVRLLKTALNKAQKRVDDLAKNAASASSGDIKERTLLDETASAHVRDGNLVSALNHLAANAKSEVYRELAKKLAPFVSGTKIGIQRDLKHKGEVVAGLYYGNQNRIAINPEFMTEEDVLHEVLHAATMQVLYNKRGNLTAEQAAAVKQLENIFASIKNNPRFEGEYGATNLDEFITEMYTDPVLRDKLDNIGKPSSLLQRIWGAVLRFFGVAPSQKVLAAIDAIMSESGRVDYAKRGADVTRASSARSAFEQRTQETRSTARQLLDAKGSLGLAMRQATADMRASLRELLQRGDFTTGMQAQASLLTADNYIGNGMAAAEQGAFQLTKDAKGYIKMSAGGSKSLADVLQMTSKIPLRKAEDRIAKFQAYVTALRGEQVGYDMLDPKDPKGAEADGRALLAEVRANPEMLSALQAAHEVYRDLNRGLIQFLKDTHSIPEDVADKLIADKNYIPFYRESGDAIEMVMPDGHPQAIGDIRSLPFLQTLKGGDDKLMAFPEAALRNISLLTNLGVQNMANRQIAYHLSSIGKTAAKPTMQVHRRDGGANRRVLRWRQEPDPAIPNDDGKRHIVLNTEGTAAEDIPTDLLVKAVAGSYATFPWLVDVAGSASNLLRAGVTRNPAYLIGQLIKDPFNASMTGNLKASPLRAIAQVIGNFGRIITDNSPEQAALRSAGVVHSNVFSGSKNDLNKVALQIAGDQQGFIKRGLAGLDKLAMSADAATRTQAYKDAIASGASEVEAIVSARELANFGRHGSEPSVQFLARAIPFFNASIQGLDATLRSAQGKMPAAQLYAAKQRFFNRALGLAAMTFAYAMAMEDDEEWRKMSLRDKISYIHIPRIFGMYDPLRLPAPFETGMLFYSMPMAMTQALKGTFTPEDWKVVRDVFLSQMPGSGSIMPQLFKGAYDVSRNYNSGTGQPIVPKNLEGKDPLYQYTARTTEAAKRMAEGLNAAGVKLSAMQIEYLANAYLGSLPVAVAQMTNQAFAKAAKADVERPTGHESDWPIIGRFFQSGRGMDDINHVYEFANKAKMANDTFNMLKSQGNAEEAREYLISHRPEIAMAPFAAQFTKVMGNIKKMEDFTRNAPNVSGEEKQKRLDKLQEQKETFAANFRKLLARAPAPA